VTSFDNQRAAAAKKPVALLGNQKGTSFGDENDNLLPVGPPAPR